MSLKNTIYKVDLYSITPDIFIYENKSKLYDIVHTFDNYNFSNLSDPYPNTKKLLTILVKQTHSLYYFKELITGKKIPLINIVINYYGKIYDYYGKESPIFIKNMIFEFNKERHDDIKVANSNDVEQYLKDHPNRKIYLEELNQMFRLSNGYYNHAYDEFIKEKEKSKMMIKKYVKNNK